MRGGRCEGAAVGNGASFESGAAAESWRARISAFQKERFMLRRRQAVRLSVPSRRPRR
jgi:hypothetical protein